MSESLAFDMDANGPLVKLFYDKFTSKDKLRCKVSEKTILIYRRKQVPWSESHGRTLLNLGVNVLAPDLITDGIDHTDRLRVNLFENTKKSQKLTRSMSACITLAKRLSLPIVLIVLPGHSLTSCWKQGSSISRYGAPCMRLGIGRKW